MNAEQHRFLSFHASRLVTQWRWLFQESQLRAFDDDGRSVTISRTSLDELIERQYARRGSGCADVAITSAGRTWLREQERVAA